MQVEEIVAKSVLVPSRLPAAEYEVNPYTGCAFSCSYCYASYTGKDVNEPVNNWGNYVYVKTNAVELFTKELQNWPRSRRHCSIFLSSVTDAYQGVEKKYRLTRGILEVLARENYPGPVSILTKSPLVLRDVDLLKRIPHAEVGVTVTTTDDAVSKLIEVHAPSASARLDTLKRLHARRISTYAFVGPLLPHYLYQPEKLDDLFRSIAQAGVKYLFVEHLNLSTYIKNRLIQFLKENSPGLEQMYLSSDTDHHREALEKLVLELIDRYSLSLILGKVLLHRRRD